jgi:hypothetical protein
LRKSSGRRRCDLVALGLDIETVHNQILAQIAGGDGEHGRFRTTPHTLAQIR